LAKRAEYLFLNVTIYGRKGRRCPIQVQGWAFKMKVTPAVSSYLEDSGTEDNG